MNTGEWEDYSTMSSQPAWITNFNPTGATFDLDSTDSSLASQTFALRFVTTDDEVPPNSIEDTFTVTFAYECQTDILTMISADGNLDTDCTFGNTASVTSAFVSQTYANCPLTSVIEVFDNGAWIPYTSSSISPAITLVGVQGAFNIDATSGALETALKPSTTFAIR